MKKWVIGGVVILLLSFVVLFCARTVYTSNGKKEAVPAQGQDRPEGP